MYIKFCRSYDVDKPSDEADRKLPPESKLLVELKQDEGDKLARSVRVYQAVCVFLSIICLTLFIIVLQSKKVETEGALGTKEVNATQSSQVCNYETCQATFPALRRQFKCPPVSSAVCRHCPKGWLHSEGSCFYLSRDRRNWNQSNTRCQELGGHLAVITNQRVQNFLSENVLSVYWIGLRQQGSHWTWVDNTGLGQSYWDEDNHSKDDCVMLVKGQPTDKNWRRFDCTGMTYYICQKTGLTALA